MQNTATHSMAFVVPLIVSLLLIAGEGGVGWHASFADAATAASAKPDRRTYWEAVLPGVPVPPAISDLLAQQNVLHSPDGFTISPNNLRSAKGLRKFGPNYEKVKSEPDHGDKHAHITSQAEDDLKEISMSYGSSQAHRSETEEILKEISVSYGLGGERDTKKVLTNLENILAAYRPQKEEKLKEISVSYGLEGQKDLKEISLSYGLEGEKDLKEILVSYGVEGENDLKEISVSYGVEGEKDLKEISVSYGVEGEKDLKEISVSYGVEGRDALKEISMSYGAEVGEGVKEISMSYGIEKNKNPMEGKASYGTEQERNLKEISVSYGAEVVGEGVKEISMLYGIEKNKNPMEVKASHGIEQERNLKEISVSYGAEVGEGVKEISMSYGIDKNKNPMEAKASYGTEQERNLKEISVSYGSAEGRHEHNVVLNQAEEDPNKATMSYGSEQEDDPNKATMSYGSEQEDDPNKVTMSYGSEQEDDPNKATMSYGSEQEEDPHKVTMSYGSEQKQGRKTMSSQHETHMNGEGGHHHHAHSQSNRRQQANVFFFHDTLRPGSIITPTIPPTTALPKLLPRGVASSIPFSTERLSDIIAMFGPASLSMTREIRWTLDTCGRPGKKAGCATSLESLAELPASLLRTRNVRAFSAADLPVEAPGTRALRGRYNVTAVRTISGESSEVVTCHDLTYPYAVYYCHTSTPTAAYAVTLASVEEGATPEKIEVLAVCHLDTSKWSPKNPFFELHNLKPGEVTVCHFLTKLSIIWVPTGEQGDAHATAR